MVVKVYNDKKLNSNVFLRTFSKDVLTEELVWHRDEKNRIITVLGGENWEIQFENTLPKKLKIGDVLNIPSSYYHRIKRGTTDLRLKIEEF